MTKILKSKTYQNTLEYNFSFDIFTEKMGTHLSYTGMEEDFLSDHKERTTCSGLESLFRKKIKLKSKEVVHLGSIPMEKHLHFYVYSTEKLMKRGKA